MLYILEDWINEGHPRALKAFRPNPIDYPKLLIVPEQFINERGDEPGERLQTISARQQFLNDTIAILEQGEQGLMGKQLLRSVGKDIEKLPSRWEDAAPGGDWQEGDGWFIVCNRLGTVLETRPTGNVVIMGPSQRDIEDGNDHKATSFGANSRNGIGDRAVLSYDPRITFEKCPRLGKIGPFIYPGELLFHELTHCDLNLKGLAFDKVLVGYFDPTQQRMVQLSREEIFVTTMSGNQSERDARGYPITYSMNPDSPGDFDKAEQILPRLKAAIENSPLHPNLKILIANLITARMRQQRLKTRN